MNKKKLFNIVRNEYGEYITNCIQHHHERFKNFLDIIYGVDDIEQMVYINLWRYIGRFDSSKSSLKSYVIQIMQTVCKQCKYLSEMEKRKRKNVCSLDKLYINMSGDAFTLEDVLVGKQDVDIDNYLSNHFYRQILKETYKRVYELVTEGYTYREIGKIFHITSQRVGQIVNSIREKIRKVEGIK